MKKTYLLSVLVILPLLVSGCSISLNTGGNTGGSQEKSADVGGLFVSGNRGDSWNQLAYGPTISGSPKNYTGLSATAIASDPQDSKAIYLGTASHGLLYTYNVNNGWLPAEGLPQAAIADVAIDPKDRCTIYAAIANRLYRSSDCSRTFQQVYIDSNEAVAISSIAVDHYNSANIYIGTSRGDIIKSIDRGESWRAISRLEGDSVAKLLISPLDSRLIFVASTRNRLYSFRSNTVTDPANSADIEANFAVLGWQDLSGPIRDFEIGSQFRGLVAATDGTLFLSSEKAIVRSRDNGIGWEKLELVAPEKDAEINAIAVAPSSVNEIYYVTDSTFFRSTDGGATWTAKKLPSSRAGAVLLVDRDRPNVIYLGIRSIN